MVSLRDVERDLKNLLFFKDQLPKRSRLWGDQIPERLSVYRNNTRTNWTDALDHDFPLTRKQFGESEWENLRRRYFVKHAPQHWELNTSLAPFPRFLEHEKVKAWVKELADYEWNDLRVFIDRAVVKRHSGISNLTAAVRVYHHQIFDWVSAGAPAQKPPAEKPEVLVFYRDSKNTCHIEEADPLMLLILEHFRKPGAQLADLEPVRQKLLPANRVPLQAVFETLQKSELLLV